MRLNRLCFTNPSTEKYIEIETPGVQNMPAHKRSVVLIAAPQSTLESSVPKPYACLLEWMLYRRFV